MPEKYFFHKAKHERSIWWWCPWNFIFSIKRFESLGFQLFFFGLRLFVWGTRDGRINHSGWISILEATRLERNAIRPSEETNMDDYVMEILKCRPVLLCCALPTATQKIHFEKPDRGKNKRLWSYCGDDDDCEYFFSPTETWSDVKADTHSSLVRSCVFRRRDLKVSSHTTRA